METGEGAEWMSQGWLKGVVKSGAAWVLMCRARVALLSPCFPQALVITSQQGHLTSSNSPEVSGGENKPMGPHYHDHNKLVMGRDHMWASGYLLELLCGSITEVGHGGHVHGPP